ncbi:hypothetical protein OJAV_G00199970 [Oryzias javanicus]|uniref:SRCR domain-containing protein n=1 Tax=Oryzias javanicus TaxID=123683 RepID=A0A437C988_ORYJA|nr:hypothetical protein OJAV_G00199970 [Oryzias javanicus]
MGVAKVLLLQLCCEVKREHTGTTARLLCWCRLAKFPRVDMRTKRLMTQSRTFSAMFSRRQRNAQFLVLCLLSSFASGQIRLTGSGSTRCSGRVEILHNDVWGTVCDYRWDLNNAKVVCKELACGTALHATKSALFGEGSGKIWLDGVECSGKESSLTHCRLGHFGTQSCTHGEDAGVVCSESLVKPNISMDPAGEVTLGQELRITCSTEAELLGETFFLQRSSDSFRQTQKSSSRTATFTISKVNFFHDGPYQCQYEKTVSDQTFTSPLSEPLSISVTVNFSKPRLSVSSADVSWGQEVGFTCSIPTQIFGGTFILMNTQTSFQKTQTSSTNFTNFVISKADIDHEGPYQCQYQKRGPHRDFTSSPSNSVRLSVNVSLQVPNTSLTSPGVEVIQGPGRVEITRGHNFTFTCSINSKSPHGRFFLIFSGYDMTNSSLAVNYSASFTFPVADFKHQGSYSCVYEVTLSAHSVTSAKSAPITVVVKQSLLLLISAVIGGILLLFLFVLFLICLVRRRKLPGNLCQNQMSIRGNGGDSEVEYDHLPEERFL